ncbi:MAG: DEAD/DEAH box helicase [Alicyclobacillus sp.]|nr:DEAD/DEAH box helicase [Alicyclobacillus sp.]
MAFLVLRAEPKHHAPELADIWAARVSRGQTVATCHLTAVWRDGHLACGDWTPLLSLADGCWLVSEPVSAGTQLVLDGLARVGEALPVDRRTLAWADVSRVLGTDGEADPSAAEAETPEADIGATCVRVFSRTTHLPYGTLQRLAQLASAVSPALVAWFTEAAEVCLQARGDAVGDGLQVVQQLVFRPAPESGLSEARGATPGTAEPDVRAATEAAALLGETSPLQQRLNGFQVRPGQLQMVESVARALEEGHHLLVEAGTGTGKSLAYLIPAVQYARRTGDRVVVSTHTIALQDQLEHRDFPLLQSALGEDVSLAVMKGRTHYLCLRKLRQEVEGVNLLTDPAEALTLMRLLVWLVQTEEGSREELAEVDALPAVWPRIQSETETCIHKRCPFFKPCYYFRARARAYGADVVVANHSLVLSDLKTNHHVLPRYSRLVVDEAHHLEQEATQHLGEEVFRSQTLGLLGRLSRDGGRHGAIPDVLARLGSTLSIAARAIQPLQKIDESLGPLRQQTEALFAMLAGLVPPGQSDLRLRPPVTDHPAFLAARQVADELQPTLDLLERWAAEVASIAEQESDEETSGRMLDATGFLNELVARLRLLADVGQADDDWVEWIECSGPPERRQVGIRRAPIDVSAILRERLFEAKDAVVLTSATLSVAGDFQFIGRRLGLLPAPGGSHRAPGETEEGGFSVETLTVPSPFDLSRQALLCVPTDVPDLSKMPAEEAAVWLADSIFQLARLSQGRLLALFTSHAMLRATADYLRDPLARRGIAVLAQGLDGNRTQVLRAFQANPRAALLGAQSFWEGIDLPGDQLTTLVIVRLPFQPPNHPVTEARSERLEAAGQSPFWQQSLPDAVVRFRQGFGRLVRTVHDRGVVVVFDRRIVTARYGQRFFQSIPGVQSFRGPERDMLRRVRDFLAESPRDIPAYAPGGAGD